MWSPPRPRLRRRPSAHRLALLHEFRVLEIHQAKLEPGFDIASRAVVILTLSLSKEVPASRVVILSGAKDLLLLAAILRLASSASSCQPLLHQLLDALQHLVLAQMSRVEHHRISAAPAETPRASDPDGRAPGVPPPWPPPARPSPVADRAASARESPDRHREKSSGRRREKPSSQYPPFHHHPATMPISRCRATIHSRTSDAPTRATPPPIHRARGCARRHPSC